jgi:hypothetical protein
MYTHITIDDTTHEFRTAREAKDYLFSLLDQRPRPSASHTRQIEAQLNRLLDISNTMPRN